MNKPKEINSLSKLKQSLWFKIRSAEGSNEYIPKLIDINPKHSNKSKFEFFIISLTNKFVFQIDIYFRY